MKDIILIATLVALASCNPTSHNTSYPSATPPPMLYSLLSETIYKLYRTYLYVKTTYPLNTIAVLLGTAYLIYLLVKYVKASFAGLLNREMTYNYSSTPNSKNVSEHITGIQRQVKDMSKYFRTAKKLQPQSQPETNIQNHLATPSHLQEKMAGMGLSGLIQDVEEKNQMNEIIEKEIKAGLQQIVNTLRTVNAGRESR